MKMSLDARRSFIRRVLSQFDKYVEYTLPVPFDPVSDVYRHHFTQNQWIALRYLMQERPKVISSASSFDLYCSGQRHLSFSFPPGLTLPGVRIRVSDLPDDVQAVVKPWTNSVWYMRGLRRELHDRCAGLVGNPQGCWRTDELGPGCNTPGQIIRIWPELQPFLGSGERARVRQASMKSRLPDRVAYGGGDDGITPEQFQCKAWNSDKNSRRRFEELSEILVKASLIVDLHHVEGYPSFSE